MIFEMLFWAYCTMGVIGILALYPWNQEGMGLRMLFLAFVCSPVFFLICATSAYYHVKAAIARTKVTR